ncbi:MAG: hypothetical protein HYY03_07960 [Chloroflexi bacterium]|nr:hypothetical protein [Chloroflexota bacterium]
MRRLLVPAAIALISLVAFAWSGGLPQGSQATGQLVCDAVIQPTFNPGNDPIIWPSQTQMNMMLGLPDANGIRSFTLADSGVIPVAGELKANNSVHATGQGTYFFPTNVTFDGNLTFFPGGDFPNVLSGTYELRGDPAPPPNLDFSLACQFEAPPQGTVQVIKTHGGTGEPLFGWTFKLHSGSGCTGEPLATAVTGEPGLVQFPGTGVGDWSVEEVAQPGWFAQNGEYCKSVTVKAGETSTVEFVNLPDYPQFNLDLKSDWNLVSTPFRIFDITDPANPVQITAPAQVFDPIDASVNSVWFYNAPGGQGGAVAGQQGQWLSYDPDLPPALNTLTAIDEGMGLWVNMKEAATLALTGQYPESTEITIYPGWNFIGYPSQQARPVAEVLAGVEYNSLWAYDPSLAPSPWLSNDPDLPPALNPLQEFEPGRGYAINVSQQQTITISNAAAVAGAGGGR